MIFLYEEGHPIEFLSIYLVALNGVLIHCFFKQYKY